MATCPKCGKEEIDACPICGEPVAVYSRIVGYLRPVWCWNSGKAQEFEDRTEYTNWDGEKIYGLTDPEWYEKYRANYTDKAKAE